MTIKVGINGFGRIGRMVFRAIDKDFDNLEVVGVNDLLDNDYLAYMLRYDSVHGRFGKDVAVEGNNFVIDGKKIRLTAERNPADLKWGDIGADARNKNRKPQPNARCAPRSGTSAALSTER